LLPGWETPGTGPLRLVPLPGLPPLPVGWAVRRWDALTPLARTFADTVARSCTERAARARHRQFE
ncbi:LysR family transcriptional regulator, partial [Streptomyces sp. MBT53]|nr:LysR family transcriptional regulator [Streptomyces sp. MBT53]